MKIKDDETKTITETSNYIALGNTTIAQVRDYLYGIAGRKSALALGPQVGTFSKYY
jgi:hypothetical protein